MADPATWRAQYSDLAGMSDEQIINWAQTMPAEDPRKERAQAELLGIGGVTSPGGGGINVAPPDPYIALQQLQYQLEWEKWVYQNKFQIQDLFKIWRGSTLSDEDLKNMASGGGNAPAIWEEYEKYREYETWRPTYHKYYGKTPTAAAIESIRARFATPGEYETWLTAGEKVAKVSPEITSLWESELGRKTPEAEQLQKWYAGGEGYGEFERLLEEARIRKKYRWQKEAVEPAVSLGKAGVFMPTMGESNY